MGEAHAACSFLSGLAAFLLFKEAIYVFLEEYQGLKEFLSFIGLGRCLKKSTQAVRGRGNGI
jgi:hypothetical protein